MQDLIIYNKNQVVIQTNEKIYQDTQANFLQDYGGKISYKAIDYNRTTESCWLDGEAFQPYPNEICENILNSIDKLLDAKNKREYIPPEPTPEHIPTEAEIQKQLTDAVQNWMDSTVQVRNYDNINSACTYANSTDHIFAAEGLACVKWRDAVWRKCYDMLAEVKAGTRAIPTAEEVIAELPALEW